MEKGSKFTLLLRSCLVVISRGILSLLTSVSLTAESDKYRSPGNKFPILGISTQPAVLLDYF